MSLMPPFDNLARTLIRRGLARADAVRLAEELADHRDDLMADLQAAGLSEEGAKTEAERRLGTVPDLTRAALRAHRHLTWCGRHPVLAYAVFPALVTPTLLVLLHLAIAAPFIFFEVPALHIPVQWQAPVAFAARCLFLAYPVVLGILYDRSVRNRALAWPWRVAAVAAPALFGIWCRQTIRFPELPDHRGMYGIGVTAMPSLVQCAVVLGMLALYFVTIHVRTERSARLA